MGCVPLISQTGCIAITLTVPVFCIYIYMCTHTHYKTNLGNVPQERSYMYWVKVGVPKSSKMCSPPTKTIYVLGTYNYMCSGSTMVLHFSSRKLATEVVEGKHQETCFCRVKYDFLDKQLQRPIYENILQKYLKHNDTMSFSKPQFFSHPPLIATTNP